MKTPNVTVTMTTQVGSSKPQTRRSRSFHTQYILILEQLIGHGAGSFDSNAMVEIGGTSKTLNSIGPHLNADPAGAGTAFGTVIGTGIGAETITNTALGTQVTANWTYGTPSFGAIGGSGGSRNFTISRTFLNNTGGSVTIEEVGIYYQSSTTAGTNQFIMIRDLTGGVVVGDGQTLTVTYKITVTV